MKAKKIIGCLMQRETSQSERKAEDSEKLFVKALINRFLLASKSYLWFNKGAHGRRFIKWTSWEGKYMLLKVDFMYKLFRKFPW